MLRLLTRPDSACSLASLALIWAASCAVFPDEAILPAGGGDAFGGMGGGMGGEVGAGAHAGDGAGQGGGSGAGGEASAGLGGTGGVPDPGGGAGGGGASCEDPQVRVTGLTSDTWIEAEKPTTGHPNDPTLVVAGGAGAERRALIAVTLPAAPAGASLLEASLVLQLQFNADTSLAARRFSLHLLEQPLIEGRATWLRWDSGAGGQWATPGGDFGPEVARADLPSGTDTGTVTFDVTDAMAARFSNQDVPLSLVIIESGSPPAAPSEVAFISSEGDDSSRPSLVIDFCPP